MYIILSLETVIINHIYQQKHYILITLVILHIINVKIYCRIAIAVRHETFYFIYVYKYK